MRFEQEKGLISVVVPVYNSRKYLEKCIDSILAQTYTNIELILVDDGSSDGASEICDVYAKEYNQVIVLHQLNKGPMAARIAGINVANGEYVGFVDSDDWIDCDYYKKMIYYMSYIIDVDVVISGMVYEGDASMFWDYTKGDICVMNANEAIFEMFSRNKFCWELCDKLYRKELFDKVHIETDIRNGEDLAANVLIFQHVKKALYASLYGYHYLRYRDKPSLYENRYNPTNGFTEAFQIVTKLYDSFPIDVRRMVVRKYICALIDELNIMFFNDVDLYRPYILIRHTELGKWIKEPHDISPKERECLDVFDKSIEDIIRVYSKDADRIKSFIQHHSPCYIYGIGKFARMIFTMVEQNGLLLDGFVVSNEKKIMESFHEHKVLKISDVLNKVKSNEYNGKIGIVIALNDYNADEVIKKIHDIVDIIRPFTCRMQVV